ncbi:hypothetical protein JZX76_18370 [Haloarcula hispanica]|uniref:Uncharacterized protein n=2 Tax=Haloarcula hispanica TaxID=51589 RepID=A0A482T4J4_HALHI|nr:hypothetical protein [Haloarcula hispanica]RYJ07707.1 hypothetical protein ELS20_18280 [Haloarcula hispanica]
MSLERVRQELLAGGLHEESVDRLLDHYQSMQDRMAESEYDEAGTHIGNFCENMVNILLDQMDENIQSRPNLGSFVNNCTSGNIGGDEPKSIRLQIPRTLRAAYDIRNNRDSVHVNLQVPVNHADTQAGIAMCSWMLAEVLRVYGDGGGTEDMEEIGDLIEELSEPVTDGNPLQDLEASHDDFDRRAVVHALDGTVQVVGDDVHPDREFNSLDTSEQVVSLLLGWRAAADLGNTDDAGASASWISGYVDVGDTRVRQIFNAYDFIQNGSENGDYQIPGFRVEEAINYLETS